MKTLKKLAERFETMITAAAFAEEGEFDTAREMLREDEKKAGKPVDKTGRTYGPELTTNAAGSR